MRTPWTRSARWVAALLLLVAAVAACATSTSPASPTDTPPSIASLGDTWARPSDGMMMVYVPGGEFEMGSAEGEVDERPAHSVALDSFWIDRTEVNNAQFRRCVEAKVCQAPATCDWGKPTYGDRSAADHPVVCVDWLTAQAYCAWAGARLPTEAEWEYAARGPQGFVYPWGDGFDCSQGNFDDETWFHNYVVQGEGCDGYEKTSPVGSFAIGISWCGTLNMAGNVQEWVTDWYGDYSSAAQKNPNGPANGDFKVLRGGAWVAFQGGVQSTLRSRDIPGSRNRNAGFRCAVSFSTGN